MTNAADSFIVAPVSGLALLSLAPHLYLSSSSASCIVDDVHSDSSSTRRSTPFPRLTAILNGGFERSEMVHISGPRGSGKTLFVLRTVLWSLLIDVKEQEEALWIDTKNSFSAFFCLEILESMIELSRKEGRRFYRSDDDHEGRSVRRRKGKDVEPVEVEREEWKSIAIRVLDRLHVTKCFDAATASQAIEQAILASKSNDRKLGIVVLDSITNLVGGQALRTAPLLGQKNLVDFIRGITFLARSSTNPLTIFLLNGTSPTPLILLPPPISQFPPHVASSTSASSTSYSDLKPALGSAFAHLMDLTLWFSKGDESWIKSKTREDGGRREEKAVTDGGKDGEMKIVELAKSGRSVSRGFTVWELDGTNMIELRDSV